MAEEGVDFVGRLLAANPNKRLTAACSLRDPWLADTGYTSNWYKTLESEYLDSGLTLDLGRYDRTLMRQIQTTDIAKYFRGVELGKESLTALLVRALETEHYSVASILVNSPAALGQQRKHQHQNIK